MNAEVKENFSSVFSKNEEILKRLSGPFSQSFDRLEKTYILNKKTNSLIESGVRDVQEEIDSHKECALDIMLDKFLDPVSTQAPVTLVDGVADTKAYDLIDLSDLAIKKEELCLKYGLSPNSSLEQIQDVITKKIKESEVNLDETIEIKKED